MNINNIFFESIYQHAWKKTIPPGLTEAEVDFILDVGNLKANDKVLDLMCGYGRHALELGRRGLEVTAIDNLKSYTEEISDLAQEQDLKVFARQEDILNAPLEGIYDAAICMGNSFAFFNREDAVSILKNIATHLKKGGIFMINSWTIAEIAIKYFREKDWHEAGEFKCVLENRFMFHPSRIESEQTVISKDGLVETLKGIDYIFTLDELETMFSEAGLRTVDLYSTPRKKKFIFGDVRIYIIAEKI